MAAQAIKNAMPTHLKPGNGNGDDEGFARKHHGKTRSHMVSSRPLFQPFCLCDGLDSLLCGPGFDSAVWIGLVSHSLGDRQFGMLSS